MTARTLSMGPEFLPVEHAYEVQDSDPAGHPRRTITPHLENPVTTDGIRVEACQEGLYIHGGLPRGGSDEGQGFRIKWQSAPCGTDPKTGQRTGRNGAFVEEVLLACWARIFDYQQSDMACPDNQEAMRHIASAIQALNRRLAARRKAGIEGKDIAVPEADEAAGSRIVDEVA